MHSKNRHLFSSKVGNLSTWRKTNFHQWAKTTESGIPGRTCYKLHSQQWPDQGTPKYIWGTTFCDADNVTTYNLPSVLLGWSQENKKENYRELTLKKLATTSPGSFQKCSVHHEGGQRRQQWRMHIETHFRMRAMSYFLKDGWRDIVLSVKIICTSCSDLREI